MENKQIKSKKRVRDLGEVYTNQREIDAIPTSDSYEVIDEISSVCYAHSLQGETQDKWQRLEDHLKNTANIASQFASTFGAGDWGYIAGMLHDLGKYSTEFQSYIREICDPNGSIGSRTGGDHSTAGSQKIVADMGKEGRLIASCIAGHHGGLLDGSGSNGSTLNYRLNKQIPPIIYPTDLPTSLPQLNCPISLSSEKMSFQLYLLTKMLYSSLVDADFLDTEAFMRKDKSIFRGIYPSIDTLRQRFWKNIQVLHKKANPSAINTIRNNIYNDCLKSADLMPGLFSLTVPTGGGKTLSSMAFAMKHAERYGHKRIIYVIPYTSIIEQNSQVFRDFIGEDAILEHHSNFEPNEEDYQSRLASENWDAPIIVTTTVQFYESFFSNKSSRSRKLHNIANSVIILDEVQNIPVEYLYPAIDLLRELTVNYKCSIVLCSATQPAIQYRDDFVQGLKGVREIVSNPDHLSISLKRVNVEIMPETEDTNISDKILMHKQVLTIVNTRRYARKLYNLIGRGEGNYHLSTLMCPAHRQQIFKEIRERLNNNQSCRVISTQLIEAGVDIDFPVVFRALAGLDSIAQAAGRCNREGKLEKGMVYIFNPESVKLSGHLLHTAQETQGILNSNSGEILSLNNIDEYFKNLFWSKGDNQLDKNDIIRDIRSGLKNLDYPFKSISQKFNLIGSDTMPVIIPFDKEAEDITCELDYKKFPVSLMRKLQKYTVNLYRYQFAALINEGHIEVKRDMFPVLIKKDMYDKETGLDVDRTQTKPEDLMV